MATKGKVIQLLYCDFCRRPITKKQVRNLGLFEMPLCTSCYEKCIKDLNGKRF